MQAKNAAVVRARIFSAVLALASLPAAAPAMAAGTWDKIADSGVVRIGVIPNRPCYYWQAEPGGEQQGFPVHMSRDIVQALSKEMGKPLKIEWQPTSWSTSVLDVQSGKIDMFVGLAITEERKRAVDMFGPMWSVPDVVIARKGVQISGKRWEDFNKPDYRVSVAMGTTTEQTAHKYLSKAQIRSMKNTNDAILDVQAGKADLFVNTLISGLAAMKENSNLSNIVVPEPLSSIPAGGILRKDGDGRLAKFVDAWVKTYHDSGKAQEVIYEELKNCGLDINLLPENTKF